jgi:hypothetical protein
MNKLTWVRRIALGVVMPLTLCAQIVTPPEFSMPESAAPPEQVKALRERVNQFFQFHVGSINRKAIDLVAEDTKDYYFSAGKVQYLGFVVQGFEFTKDFQKAFVRMETTQNQQIQQYTFVATTPMVTKWKLEDGKWVWYLDKEAFQPMTPMSTSAHPGAVAQVTPASLINPDGTLNFPKDIAAQGQAILKPSGLDKNTVALVSGAAGQSEVTFHNGYPGQVSLKLYGAPQVPGLTVTLSKSDLDAGQDGVIRLVYNPAPGSLADAPGREYTLRLSLIPFNQEFPIKLTFQSPK